MKGGTYPWALWLNHAVRTLNMSPDGFWRLSMAEWRALTGGHARTADRRELEDLMRRFPDGKAR